MMTLTTRRIVGWLLAFAALLIVVVLALNVRDEPRIPAGPETFAATPQQIERGAYLARAGNCAACHTARGGAEYAGGRGIDTPFGTVYSSNLTPDAESGIGSWTSAHFWRAMHNGRARDGRLLYPAFPYPSYTQVTREDSDAIYAYLRSLAPVRQANRAHALRFPYNTQASLAVWRALFFSPGVYVAEPANSAQWNRGAYLVRGLGHCIACHSSRNVFGATSEKLELSGGLIPMQHWYAPSLASPTEAGVAEWDTAHVVGLLKNGVSPRGTVMGPMAEVVYRSTQHLSDADLAAMAVFLKELPQLEANTEPGVIERFVALLRPKEGPTDPVLLTRGAKLYEQRCATCHGKEGQGAAGAYVPLAGNRAVTMSSPVNVIRAIVNGGFPPSTAGNPRPYGMPPFGHELSHADIAAVATYIRASWGNQAAPVSQLEVLQSR